MRAACLRVFIIFLGVMSGGVLCGVDVPLPVMKPGAKTVVGSKRAIPTMPSRMGGTAMSKKDKKKMASEMPRPYVQQLMEFIKNEKEVVIPEHVRMAANDGIEEFKDLLMRSENAQWFKQISEKIALIVAGAEQERRMLMTRIKRGREQREMRNNLRILKTSVADMVEKQDKIVAGVEKITEMLEKK
ncbi:hypothetical protein KAU11_01205 [Candidatus Babeliales bacterium]|nr:hypothetical protein [Candidatus Babeliales bacterium]